MPEASIKTFFNDLLNLLYPRLCESCGDLLIGDEELLCTTCIYNIPKTRYHLHKNNPVAQAFWGRISIEHASSYFYFSKGGKYRKLLHKLKYRGKQEIGYILGKAYGTELKLNGIYQDVDIIVPVPLHPDKEKSRGFNQSDPIAFGIAEAFSKPVEKALARKVNNPTQTRKSRYERWENVESVFSVILPEKVKEKHVLLVDDVITTGATLEACARVLQETAQCRVSIVTLAVT